MSSCDKELRGRCNTWALRDREAKLRIQRAGDGRLAAAARAGAGAAPPTRAGDGRCLFRGAASPVPATNPKPFGHLPASAFAARPERWRVLGDVSFSTSYSRTTHLFQSWLVPQCNSRSRPVRWQKAGAGPTEHRAAGQEQQDPNSIRLTWLP